jgi:DNA-binding transcriptional LysR family regulator
MDRLTAMATFVRVVEAGSLSAGARNLDLPLTSVSRQVSGLEDLLGARLLVRTTRRLALTEEGRAYYDRVKRILGDVEEAELMLATHAAEPTGRLVVGAPVLFGRLFVAPLLPGFLARHPRLTVDLMLADRFVNLVEEGCDLAVRAGFLEDSSLIARKLGSMRRVICGAPSYLAARGEPQTPQDLETHDCILFTLLDGDQRWTFNSPSGEASIAVSGRFRTNNADSALAAALGGAGLVFAPLLQVRNHLASGELKVVLQQFEMPPSPLYALFPHARLMSPKVRAFTELMIEFFANDTSQRADQEKRKRGSAMRECSPMTGC